MKAEYIYLGDRFSAAWCKGKPCTAVRRSTTGKCIRGRNGNMLVSFNGIQVVVLARCLRKIKKETIKKSNKIKNELHKKGG